MPRWRRGGGWSVGSRGTPQLRPIELGFADFAVAEHGTWLATIMYAYDRGGEHGDRYDVIDRGEAEVSIGGRHVRVIGAGRGFGELALLHDVQRTAAVVAAADLDLLAFGREQFLQAITGHARSAAIASERTERLLGPAT